MDLTSFRNLRPEFSTALDAMVQGALDDAALQIDAAIYGEKYDHAHGLLAAHLLAMSPFGHSARLEDGKGDTSIYWPEYSKVRRLVAPRFMVL